MHKPTERALTDVAPSENFPIPMCREAIARVAEAFVRCGGRGLHFRHKHAASLLDARAACSSAAFPAPPRAQPLPACVAATCGSALPSIRLASRCDDDTASDRFCCPSTSPSPRSPPLHDLRNPGAACTSACLCQSANAQSASPAVPTRLPRRQSQTSSSLPSTLRPRGLLEYTSASMQSHLSV